MNMHKIGLLINYLKYKKRITTVFFEKWLKKLYLLWSSSQYSHALYILSYMLSLEKRTCLFCRLCKLVSKLTSFPVWIKLWAKKSVFPCHALHDASSFSEDKFVINWKVKNPCFVVLFFSLSNTGKEGVSNNFCSERGCDIIHKGSWGADAKKVPFFFPVQSHMRQAVRGMLAVMPASAEMGIHLSSKIWPR